MKRTCTTCKVPKPLDPEHFHRLHSDPEGFDRACKRCVNARIRRCRASQGRGSYGPAEEDTGPTLADVHRIEAAARRRSAAALRSISEQTRAVRPLLRSVVVLVLVLSACATLRTRQACRTECEPLRGPVWSLGGPTIAPRSWDDCMSACELGEGPSDE
jgi:hypothetical protein